MKKPFHILPAPFIWQAEMRVTMLITASLYPTKRKLIVKPKPNFSTRSASNPTTADYRLMLAELFIKIGLVKRAEGELTRILEKSPNNREARSLLDSLLNK